MHITTGIYGDMPCEKGRNLENFMKTLEIPMQTVYNNCVKIA